MSKDHEGDFRGFVLASEAWYKETALNRPRLSNEKVIDDVTFGLFSPEGGTSGEMGMRWYDLGGRLYPRLECFDDGWHTLATFKDVIDKLAEVDDQSLTPEAFCELLRGCDFRDITPRTYEESYPDRKRQAR